MSETRKDTREILADILSENYNEAEEKIVAVVGSHLAKKLDERKIEIAKKKFGQ